MARNRFRYGAWNGGPEQFRQIEEKINRYMGYVLDGHLVTHYPQYEGRPVAIRLDCAEPARIAPEAPLRYSKIQVWRSLTS